MTELFNSGFETEDNTFTVEWTGKTEGTNCTMTVVDTQQHHGTYSAESYADLSNTSMCYKTLGAHYDTIYARFYIKQTDITCGNGDNIAIMRLSDTDNYECMRLGFRYIGGDYIFCLWYQDGGWNRADSATLFPLNEWMCIEVKHVTHATTGEDRVYLNGVEINDLTQTGINTSGDSANQLCLGALVGYADIYSAETHFTNYIDCVVVADTYIGPEAAGGLSIPVAMHHFNMM